MAWALDAAVAALFVLWIVFGYRRGFFKSVMRLVSGIAALLVAAWLAAPVSEFLFDRLIGERLQTGLEEQMTQTGETVEASLADGFDRFLAGLPTSVRQLLERQGVRSGRETLAGLSLAEDATAAQAAQTVTQEVVRPTVLLLLQLVCFVALFLLLWLLLSLLTRLLDKVLKRLPVLRQVNRALGAVVGALEGLLLVWLVSTLIGWQARMASPDAWLTTDMVEDTVIVQHFDRSERWLAEGEVPVGYGE